MPAKNSIKEYVENSFYHIYNRGVEKRLIFQDEQDCAVFLGYLKEYLLPKDENSLRKSLADSTLSPKQKDKILKLLRLNNFSSTITLIAYCLMPNHFHLLVKQSEADSIDKFMQSLCTRYTMYFNRKYKRVGSLFQSVYKAVIVVSDKQLLYLTKYIHQQAMNLFNRPSSLMEYLGERNTLWIKPAEVLSFFSKGNRLLSYEAFVKEYDDFEVVNKLTIDE